MEVTFWGVRGSHPVPGNGTIRYGGQTSCVEVVSASGDRVILDAGTGLAALGMKLLAQPDGGVGHYHFLLSHVHWDHIQGLPFFKPIYLRGTQLTVHCLRTAADELRQVIEGAARREFFPVPLAEAVAEVEYHEVAAGTTFNLAGFEVVSFMLNHPLGAMGYRLNADGQSVAYVSDTAPFHEVLHKSHFLSGLEPLTEADRASLSQLRDDLRNALRGTDTVIYDTHFTPDEYARFPHFGHSTPDQALELCHDINVGRLVLFHHAPGHDDAMMDSIAEHYAKRGREMGIEVVTSRERMTLSAGRAPRDGAS